MNRRVLIFVAVLALMPTSARSQPGPAPGAGVPGSPSQRPAESEPVSLRKTEDSLPTPAAGFALERRRVGIKLEVGFPFVLFQLSYGIGAGLELMVGYRGFYTLTPGAFAGIKGQLVTNTARNVGLSLMALGGWNHLKKEWDFITQFTGGTGGFGEVWLMFTGRRGRHGMFANGGTRVSQVQACTMDMSLSPDCDNHILKGKDGIAVTIFAELGYEVRIMKHASYYVAGGADMFPNSKQWEGMFRFRTGIIMDF